VIKNSIQKRIWSGYWRRWS